MDSVAPFPISALSPQSDISVTLEAFRWLLVLGFPTTVAAACVWPDLFAADDEESRATETDLMTGT